MANSQAFLGRAKTAGYKPGLLGGPSRRWDHRGFFHLLDVEQMRRDPQVRFGLRLLYAPLPSVTWEVDGDQEVVTFVDSTLRRVWTNHLDALFKLVVYGNIAGEVLYQADEAARQITFDRINDVHPHDARPLVRDGKLAGISVRGVEEDRGWILPPRSLWIANEAEFGSLYGQSRLAEAWYPWQEKTARHGALDIRRLWYLKNAFRGGRMRHPLGDLEVEPGVFRSCRDYAREIVETFETGGVLTLPNQFNKETGKYEWEWEDPAAFGEPPGVREYVQTLDDEILVALGIPPEVARAAEVGSGWSGRSIPFVVYLSGEDAIASTILSGLNEQIARPLVAVNFSLAAARSYQVRPRSLVPPEAKEQATQGAAGTPGAERVILRRESLSQEGDGGSKEKRSTSRMVDSLLDQGASAALTIADEIREQVRQIVKKKYPPRS